MEDNKSLILKSIFKNLLSAKCNLVQRLTIYMNTTGTLGAYVIYTHTFFATTCPTSNLHNLLSFYLRFILV